MRVYLRRLHIVVFRRARSFQNPIGLIVTVCPIARNVAAYTRAPVRVVNLRYSMLGVNTSQKMGLLIFCPYRQFPGVNNRYRILGHIPE